MHAPAIQRTRLIGISSVIGLAIGLVGCQSPQAGPTMRWHEKHAYVRDVPPIVFHYDHGELAGSYPDGVETVAVEFDDVCAQLGHVCLCGAGGFRIADDIVAALRAGGPPLERGDFVLISGRDHTVSDVIAFVLGCVRRNAADRNQYFIDASIKPPKREYHYYVAYPPAQTAVRVIYRKHLLIGNEKMDQLWQIELAFEHTPSEVSDEDINRYREAMLQMVQDALFNRIPNLVTVERIPYEEFRQRLDAIAQ